MVWTSDDLLSIGLSVTQRNLNRYINCSFNKLHLNMTYDACKTPTVCISLIALMPAILNSLLVTELRDITRIILNSFYKPWRYMSIFYHFQTFSTRSLVSSSKQGSVADTMATYLLARFRFQQFEICCSLKSNHFACTEGYLSNNIFINHTAMKCIICPLTVWNIKQARINMYIWENHLYSLYHCI